MLEVIVLHVCKSIILLWEIRSQHIAEVVGDSNS